MFFSQKKINKFLYYYHKKFPHIVSFETIGKSVLGNPIIMVKLMSETSHKTAILFTGCVHGDEVVGVELCKRLLKYLCKNPSAISCCVYILFTLNPDGYGHFENNLWQPRRENANNIDLNRDFTNSSVEPETLSLIRWFKQHSIILSITFHTGTLGINYPFDNGISGVENQTLHEKTFQQISQEYLQYNSFMRQHSEFENGMINGAKWYAIEGSLSDWRYLYNNEGFDLTIEVSSKSILNKDEMNKVWEQNKQAMIQMIKVASDLKNEKTFKMSL